MGATQKEAVKGKEAPVRKLPKRTRGEVRVRALLDSAEAVFAEVGYDDATMGAIAQRAKASVGSLYQFFPGKEAIGIALIDEYLELLARDWAAIGTNLREGNIEKLCRSLTFTTREFIAARPAYRVLDSIPGRTGLQPNNRVALLAELQVLIARVAPACKFSDREKIAAVVLQLIKSQYALDHIVEQKLAAEAREEILFVMESYLTQRLTR